MAPPSKKNPTKKTGDRPMFNKASKKPFKTKKQAGNVSKSEFLSMQLEDDVPDFPRGGGSTLTRQERDEIYAEVDKEFQSEERKQKRNGKKIKQKQKRPAVEDDLGSLFRSGGGNLPRYANKITLKNITPGMKLWGVVAEVNEEDMVVSLPGGLRGLVRASDVFDPLFSSDVEDLEHNLLPRLFYVGQLVPCTVLQLDDDKKEKKKRKIWLSLQLSLLNKAFTLESLQEGMGAYIKNKNDLHSTEKQELDEDSGDEYLPPLPNMDTECNDDDDAENNDDEFSTFATAKSRAFIPPLEVNLDDPCPAGIDNGNLRNEEHIDSVDNFTERKNRREKKKAMEEREKEIIAAEERLLEKDIPRSADEFEKLVRSSPNSSFVWLKYMAFMLSVADVEKARSIAERALRTINIREEDEKLNVWVAYFNLENEYGNPPEEAVRKNFQRALQYNDPKKVHLALLGMYERTEQHALADELLEKMVKRFKHSCKVWLRRMQSLLNQQQDRVQSVRNRALICLPKHKHIKFISHTAILEFKCGVPERGRSMFEGILREYPKRTDLWNVYLDQEIRLGDVDLIRALFERAINLSLPPKKMKSLFKKYLEYEKSLGDEERIESVKKKALNYVESTLA